MTKVNRILDQQLDILRLKSEGGQTLDGDEIESFAKMAKLALVLTRNKKLAKGRLSNGQFVADDELLGAASEEEVK